MKIKTVGIVGRGALGMMFGSIIQENAEPGTLSFVIDAQRREAYRSQGVQVNGHPFTFEYRTAGEGVEPSDLLMFAVKAGDLEQAMEEAAPFVGEHTILMSLLNGVTSEELLGERFGKERVLYTVAQGMDAVREGKDLTYANVGVLCFGEKNGEWSDKVEAVAEFFHRVKVPYEIRKDMPHHLYSKLMLNTGVNQTVAIYEGDYGTIQREGAPRQEMLAAMREVISVAAAEGIDLGEEDVDYWLKVLATLNPQGKPSMRQDLEQGRKSEVELFAGTICRLGDVHGIDTPVNDYFYKRIKEMEASFR